MSSRHPGQTPAEWLIEQYEQAELDRDSRPDQRRAVVVQPMYRLKSVMDAGHAMRVVPADYRDSGRRWL